MSANDSRRYTMILLKNGNVGIGTTTPGGMFAVNNGPYEGLLMDVINDNSSWLGSYTNIQTGDCAWGGNSESVLYLQGKNGNVGIGTTGGTNGYRLYVNGTTFATGGWTGSDVRWGKSIIPIENVLGQLFELDGLTYEWRQDEFPEMKYEDGEQIGVMAQEVEKVLPELV